MHPIRLSTSYEVDVSFSQTARCFLLSVSEICQQLHNRRFSCSVRTQKSIDFSFFTCMDTFVTRFFSPMVFVSLFVCTTYVISSASFLITILANENFKTLDEFLRISFFHLKCKESVSEETLMQFYRECSFTFSSLSTQSLHRAAVQSLRDRKPQTIP